MTSQPWTADRVLELSRAFMPSCVIHAAAELDLFDALRGPPKDLAALAAGIDGDERATRILLDAMTAMGLLVKSDKGLYSLAAGVEDVLTEGGDQNCLAMVRHHANCLRTWSQLAAVVRSGKRAEKTPSVRGGAGDLESFIEAMQVVSRGAAGPVVERIGPPKFKHLLDVGGGPGTWTVAFLAAAEPDSRATLFDLPDVLPIAEKHFREAGLLDRVTLAGGNFDTDPALPGGCDLAWVSAIVHMNSREENRSLFAKVFAALEPGGLILIRDMVMDESRTEPAEGALFAVNMLVNTPGGDTYTLGELSADLAAAGFVEAELIHRDPGMSSVVQARKP